MQAVILAAGLGSRIRQYHDLPKGFIEVGERPIIAESIDRLKRQGIKDILIVTGYHAEIYDEFAENDPAISTVFNPDFKNSGSLYSLYCARQWVHESFILLESDLVYSQRALAALCEDSHPNIVLLSGATQSGDEVYVQANDMQLINMSKQIEALNVESIFGEFVGVNKLSYSAYRQLIELLETNHSLLKTGHYEEDGLVALSAACPIFCLKLPNLLWCEIDNLSHLERAKKLYPLIEKDLAGAEYAS